MQSNHQTSSQKYRVRVGHVEVTVECGRPEDAVLMARQKISAEMPRFWDVIHALDVQKFRIDPAH